MGKRSQLFVWFGLSVFGLCSCSKDDSAASGPTGTFSMSVQASGEVIVGQSVSRVGEDAENGSGNPLPEVDDFSVSVSNHGESVLEWSAFREMKEEGNCELRPGTYTAEAWYGDVEKEGFGQDYFAGSQEFAVKRGENTPVSVTCYRGNALLSVVYTDEFKSYFSASYSAEVFSSLGNTVEYVQDESRFASFAPGELSVSVRVKKPGQAEEAEYPVMAFPAEARHAYTLTLDVDVSSATMTVSFSDKVSEESVEFDVSDEALNTPAPYLKANGFQDGEALSPVEGADWKSAVSVVANAEAGLASFRMRVVSSYVEGMGVTGEVDLMSSDPNVETLRTLGLGMKGLMGNVDRMALIDYTALVGNLPAGNDENSFTVYAVDNYGKKSDELTLKVTPQFCGFAVAAAEGEVPFLGNTCRVNISFIDGAPSKASFSLADGGQPLTVTQVSEVTEAEGRKQYTIDLQAPDGVQFKEPFKVSASYLTYNETTDDLDVGFGILVDDKVRDVRAKRAVLHLYNEEMDNVDFEYKTGNGAWQALEKAEVDGSFLTARNLTPSSQVTFRALRSGVSSNEESVQTENIFELPNPGFETWTVGPDGMEGHGDVTSLWAVVTYNRTPYRSWERWYPYKTENSPHWDTLNEYTTSDGTESKTATASSHNTARYVANSGTLRSTVYRSGAYSALIRTVGWGSGSTAAFSIDCDHITVGELYLGEYQSGGTASYGVACDSRPDALRFYYKYYRQNSDSFVAEIRVYNGDTEIGSGIAGSNVTSAARDSWSDAIDIPIVYAVDNLRATSISVIFKSGISTSTDDIMVTPSFSNLTTGEYVGSQLYIDDVSLIYE